MNRKHFSDSALDPSDTSIDVLDRRILRELQTDGRMPFAELARRVSLSAPAVGERVRRLERVGIIDGYRAQIPPLALGRPITAFIRVATEGSRSRQERLLEHVATLDSIIECHGTTGEESYIMKVAVGSTAELDALTSTLATYGRTTTSVVLSTPIDHGGVPVAVPRRGR